MTLIPLPIRLIPIVFGSLTSREDLDDIHAFFEDKNTDKYDMVLQQTKDTIRNAIEWLDRDREDVTEVRALRLDAFMSLNNLIVEVAPSKSIFVLDLTRSNLATRYVAQLRAFSTDAEIYRYLYYSEWFTTHQVVFALYRIGPQVICPQRNKQSNSRYICKLIMIHEAPHPEGQSSGIGF